MVFLDLKYKLQQLNRTVLRTECLGGGGGKRVQHSRFLLLRELKSHGKAGQWFKPVELSAGACLNNKS